MYLNKKTRHKHNENGEQTAGMITLSTIGSAQK